MKRKETPKPENAKVIDPAILEMILGGVPPAVGAPKTAVIEQAPFGSFYHS